MSDLIPKVSYSSEDLLTESRALILSEGFYSIEDWGAWSEKSSKLLCTGKYEIYVESAISLKVVMGRGVNKFMLDLDEYKSFIIDIDTGNGKVEEISFEADTDFVPALNDSQSSDVRRLSFKLKWDFSKISNPPSKSVPIPHEIVDVFFVARAKKEEEVLLPIYEELKARGWRAALFTPDTAICYIEKYLPRNQYIVVASPETHSAIYSVARTAHYIFCEHGTGYLKRYSYSSHYKRYDLLLLPSKIMVERTERLFPETRGKCVSSGFPKIKSISEVGAKKKKNLCEMFGFEENEPVILFAPTYSEAEEKGGVFNIKKLSSIKNLFCIPHSADYKYFEMISGQGYNILILADGENISDYFGCADMMISDISSAAIEFAAVGRPVVCALHDHIPDFDKSSVIDGRVKIPHSDHFWDFCPVMTLDEIPSFVESMIGDFSNDSDFFKDFLSGYTPIKYFIEAIDREAAEICVNAIEEYFIKPRLSKSIGGSPKNL